MGRLSSPEQVRARAAECRARAAHPVLRPDAAEWLGLADTWDRLAEAMEASAYEERVHNTPARVAEEPTERVGGETGGGEGAGLRLVPEFQVEGGAVANPDLSKQPDPEKPVREGKKHPGSIKPKKRK